MKILKLFLLLTALGFCDTILADTPGGDPIVIPIGDKKPGKGKGGRDVSSPVPQCYINEGVLYVESPDDWSYATVTVEETESGAVSVSSGYLNEGIAVYIPASEGYFTITIVTESGDEFEGEFCL